MIPRSGEFNMIFYTNTIYELIYEYFVLSMVHDIHA